MLAYLLCALLAWLLLVLYRNVWRPWRLLNFYKAQMADKSYRAHFMKFMPFYSELIALMNRDAKQHNDSYWQAKNPSKQSDLTVANFADRVMITLVKPQLIKQLYALDGGDTYVKQQELVYNIRRLAGISISFSHGEIWKSKRKFMTGFLNFNYVNQQLQSLSALVNRKIDEQAQGRKEFEIYLLQLLEQITGNTIVQLFFGGSPNSIDNYEIQGKKISTLMRQIMEQFGEQFLDPLTFMFGPRFPELNLRAFDREVSRKVRLFRQFTANFVKGRIYEIQQGESAREDYIEKIYHSVTQAERTEQFVKGIVDDFCTLYIAGTDTTSHSAMMLVYLILMRPQVQSQLRKQISEHIKSEKDINHSVIKQMKYLDCVVHEAMRYFQPANGLLFREATHDHYLADIKIKKGTLLNTSSLTNHYDAHYFPQPSEFKPERWLKEDGSFNAPKPYTWLTFSAGPRSCIGKQVAFIEMKLIVIILFQRFDMKMETEDLKMMLNNFSYMPQKMMVKFTERS